MQEGETIQIRITFERKHRNPDSRPCAPPPPPHIEERDWPDATQVFYMMHDFAPGALFVGTR